ncbi:MAG TPA: PadR family transcriptional regulator [Steroidobacteraceae bacterium]|nr:PadR family transcriptional regulator [Steroidobacteraceae bacterium]
MARDPNPNFMAGVPELMVLRLLQDREMYGYEIVEAIKTETAEVISFGEGVVYPLLHHLEEEGALTSRRKLVGGRSRVYYTLTAKGARRYGQLAQTWTSLAEAIHSALKGARHAPEL